MDKLVIPTSQLRSLLQHEYLCAQVLALACRMPATCRAKLSCLDLRTRPDIFAYLSEIGADDAFALATKLSDEQLMEDDYHHVDRWTSGLDELVDDALDILMEL